MNYSNLVADGNLKKSFVVATLISTVIGTFTASMNLHDKVQEKRQQRKQQALDSKQDAEIKKLESQVRRLQSQGSSELRDSSDTASSSRDRSVRAKSRSGRESESDADGDFSRTTKRSKAMIEDRYDEYVSRLGNRFSQGDLITENKLQAQIISLQQTVINVLQDALLNDRSLTKADINKLVAAQQSARAGTLDALQDQYSRMRPANGDKRPSRLQIDMAEPLAPVRRIQTEPAAPATAPSQPTTPFCRYSEDLQRGRARALGPAFSGPGESRCPACGVRLRVDQNSIWAFSVPGEGTFELDARFVVKCHTPDGGFACAICFRRRDVDCFCGNVESLVRHIGRDHSIAELEAEEDFTRRD